MQEQLELSLYITVKSKDSDSVLHFIWFGEAYTPTALAKTCAR